MKLLNKETEAQLPRMRETEHINTDDKMLVVKFFTPDSSWTWYAVEYDPEEKIFFGFVNGIFPEWGYFSLQELETAKGPLGLEIERDLHWTPIKFRTLNIAERIMS